MKKQSIRRKAQVREFVVVADRIGDGKKFEISLHTLNQFVESAFLEVNPKRITLHFNETMGLTVSGPTRARIPG